MENEVMGEPITPAELATPGWAHIRRKQKAIRNVESPSQQASVSAQRARSTARGQKRPTPRIAPIEPFPPNDVKIVLRPRGGLALATLPVAALADTIQAHAQVTPNCEDQIRIQARSNFIVVSTPSEDRALKYAALSSIVIGEQRYEVASHVPAPANTALGIIFNIPETDTPDQIEQSIFNYNPHLKILDVRRLNTSNMAQILFDGPHVPYWIRYRAATYRCKPLRRKTEACARCWQSGHRQDVCPNRQTAHRCPRCGTTDAPENHPCTPRCIVCEGTHLTGSADCPRRYRPRPRRPLSYAQVVGQQSPPTLDSFPPLQAKDHKKSPSKTASNERHSGNPQHLMHKTPPEIQRQQVSGSRVPPSSQLQPPPVIPPNNNSLADVLRELQTIRTEIAALKEENAALKRENYMLKHHPPPRENPTSPPPKRKALSNSSSEEPQNQPPERSSSQTETRFERLECTLTEQKAEYTQFYQSLLSAQAAMQSSIEAMRAELHGCLSQFVTPYNAPLPQDFDITDEANP